MPRDIICTDDADRALSLFHAIRDERQREAKRAERLDPVVRDANALAYMDRQYDRHVAMTRRQVRMFCAAIVGVGAASVIAQVW